MKRIYAITALLLLCCAFTFAQEEQLSEKIQLPKHELQFGIGDPFMVQPYCAHFWDSGKDVFFLFNPFWAIAFDASPWSYVQYRYSTPAISATYHYRLRDWLWIGGFASYTGVFSDNVIDGVCYDLQEHFVIVSPSIRASFLNKKYVTLYAGLSCSAMWRIVNDAATSLPKSTPHIAGQITTFGISVGKKWFGYAELGYGNRGIISAGFGYKFTPEKKK